MNRFNSFSTSLLLLLLCLAHKSVTAEDNAKALAAPTEGNAVETEEQIVVTLGPPRDGIQRALIDEVEGNKIAILPSLDDKGRVRPGDLDGYDDNFVELREEEPIFIPRPYRNETTTTTTTTTTTPQPTTARTRPPVQKPQQPVQSQRQPQPFRPNQIVQPRPQPQLQPQSNLQPQFRPQPPQPPPFVQPQQPVQSRPVVPQRLQPQPQPQRPQPNTIVQPQQPFVPTPQQQQKQQQQRPTATLPPAFPTVPQFPVNQRPVRPRPQPPHSPPRVALPSRTTGQTTAPNLRTGVCHASIFYISSPLETRSRLTFTHFAIAVSVDQCARTCHEFNCAIAHFDPANGHCQFNPSTAFAVREGQCPRWPSAHYRNNVMTQGAIRIFCVQCHRPFRRGRGRSHGGRFRTRIVQPQFTGRLTSALARSAKISSKRISLDDSSLLNGRDDNDHNYESTNIRNIHQPTNNTKWDAEKDERLEVDINELERKVIEMTRKNEGGIQHSLKSSAIVREQHSAETSANESENL